MKVFIVYWSYRKGEMDIRGVFSDIKLAQEYIAKLNTEDLEALFIQRWTIDEPIKYDD